MHPLFLLDTGKFLVKWYVHQGDNLDCDPYYYLDVLCDKSYFVIRLDVVHKCLHALMKALDSH